MFRANAAGTPLACTSGLRLQVEAFDVTCRPHPFLLLAPVAQMAGGGSLRKSTVQVRILLGAPTFVIPGRAERRVPGIHCEFVFTLPTNGFRTAAIAR